jgi:DUF2934 family protein
MAKRTTRRPPQTSDPDVGVMTETHTDVQGDEVREASAAQKVPVAVASDRPQTTAADVREGEVTYDDIAALAYDLWVRRGHAHGNDFDDWLQAERELRERRQ